MSKSRKIRNQKIKVVFLDTDFFIENNFDYKNNTFANLLRLVNSHQITIYISDIIRREVLNNISKSVSDAEDQIKRLRTNAKILRNCEKNNFSSIFKTINNSFVESELSGQFSQAIKFFRIKIISTESVSIKEVFNSYFASQPPFLNKKDKKNEFPDAFSLFALENWCQKEDLMAYVISKDIPIEKFCEESKWLIAIKNIDKLFEKFTFDNIPLPDKFRIRKTAENYLTQKNDEILESVEGLFEKSGFVVYDVDGDVTEVNVEKIKLIDKSITNLNENEIVYKLIFGIGFNVQIDYVDPGSMMYYNEERGVFHSENENKTVEEYVEIGVILTIFKEANDDESNYHHELEFENNDDFIIHANIYDF